MKWYVIQTKPMSEDKVCKQLDGAFCPKIKFMAGLKNGGDVIRYKPLFPSYIFLRHDLGEPANHQMVKYTRGVNKILGDGERPVPISDEIVEIIKSRANESGILEQKVFKTGEAVKVKRGFLRDLMGVLERPVSDSGRVAVLLTLFNRQMKVQMKCTDIARA